MEVKRQVNASKASQALPPMAATFGAHHFGIPGKTSSRLACLVAVAQKPHSQKVIAV